MAYMEWGGNDPNAPDLKPTGTPKFKMRTGQKARVSFASYPIINGKLDLSAAKPKFIGGPRIYIPGVGYALYRPELRAYGKPGEDIKVYIGTVVVSWPLKRDGEPDQRRILDGEYDVEAYIFTQKRYELFEAHWKNFPAKGSDMLLICEDEEFQKIQMVPCPNNLLMQLLANEKYASLSADITARVLDLVEVDPETNCSKLGAEIGRDLTVDQVRARLNAKGHLAGGAAASAPSSQSVESAAKLDEMFDIEVP